MNPHILEHRIAIYVDVQNIYLAHSSQPVHEKLDAMRERVAFVEEQIKLYGVIALRRAYWPAGGKYEQSEEDAVIQILEERGYEIRNGPVGKDTDTKMVADCVDDMYRDQFSAAAIVAGDTDYAPAAQILHENHKPFYVFAIRDSIREGGELQQHAEATIYLPSVIPCAHCGGTGRYTEPCWHCGGTGQYGEDRSCWTCNGTGEYDKGICYACNGVGKFRSYT